jgi:hypothetical protein
LPKFTNVERILLKSMVATLSIKRVPESDIIKEIFHQTNKTITTRYLSDVKQQIKKDSYHCTRPFNKASLNISTNSNKG